MDIPIVINIPTYTSILFYFNYNNIIIFSGSERVHVMINVTILLFILILFAQ